ncbi:MAG TPA: divalent metal cation transporter, partial [Polyangiaceae bacterium]
TYTLIRNVFRWLALSLLGYGAAAWLARPDFHAVVKGTFVPTIRLDKDFLSMVVAVMGTTLSAYLYTWQSNQEVEEEKAMGRTELWQRIGATDAELRSTRIDVALGMLFSNLIMYFIILSTASTLHRSGHTEVDSALDAARALEPVAGKAASWLFALGILAVGFLAVPVVTTGAAYDVAQTFGWRHGLAEKPKGAKAFYATIGAFTVIGAAFCMLGLNPMRMLVWAGIAQGFTTPPLILLILILTNRRQIMGSRVNGYTANILGGLTTLLAFTATISLIVAWFT